MGYDAGIAYCRVAGIEFECPDEQNRENDDHIITNDFRMNMFSYTPNTIKIRLLEKILNKERMLCEAKGCDSSKDPIDLRMCCKKCSDDVKRTYCCDCFRDQALQKLPCGHNLVSAQREDIKNY